MISLLVSIMYHSPLRRIVRLLRRWLGMCERCGAWPGRGSGNVFETFLGERICDVCDILYYK